MPLPHNFIPQVGGEQMIPVGTYYRLEPIQGATNSHVITAPVYLPVIDTVNWSFNHVYNEADNLSKNIIDSVEGLAPTIAGVSTGRQLSKYMQRKLGGSVHISSCAVYVDSAPPTINVRSKVFSPDGSGQLLTLVELLRQDTHGSLGGSGMKQRLGQLGGTIGRGLGNLGKATGISGASGPGGQKLGRAAGETAVDGIQSVTSFVDSAANAGGNKVLQSGPIDHPEWWKIQVVTFGRTGQTILATMEDMLCKGMNVVFYAPFYDGEPSMIEIDMAFQHGFRGVRQSMRFGA